MCLWEEASLYPLSVYIWYIPIIRPPLSMDPLTTAITVSTFLGSIIKLAEEIKKSLEKVPKNRKRLRIISEDVLRGLLELGRFYDERGHVLDGSAELQAALDSLASNIRSVYTRCCLEASVKAHSPINRAMAGFKVWYKASEIEAEISALRNEVQECYLRFTAFAVARLDKHMTKIAMSTSRIEETIFLLHQHQQADHNRSEGIAATFQGNRHDIQSARAIADVDAKALTIPSRTIENLYLRQQVEIIAHSFSRLASKTSFSQEGPNGPYTYPLAPTIISCGSPSVYHRRAVSGALEILRLLHDEPGQLSIKIGAWNTVNLAIRLHSLEMYSEAVILGNWTVNLYRTLTAINTAVFGPYLALSLHNLSRFFVDIGDDGNAEITLGESIKLLRNLLRTQPQTNLHLLLSNSLMASWSILTKKKHTELGLEAAHESLAMLEIIQQDLNQRLLAESPHVLMSPAITQLSPYTDSGGEPMSQTNSFPHTDKNVTMWLLFNRARASYGISCSLYDLGRYPEALEMGERSFDILSSLANQYPGPFDAALAGCLVHLSRPHIGVGRSIEDALNFSEKAVQIYRRLYRARPNKTTKPLIKTLWECAILLSEIGKKEAVKLIAEEAISIVRQSEKDERLLAEALRHSSWMLRHLDLNERAVDLGREVVAIHRGLAAGTSLTEILADRMCDLSCDLHLANQLNDAIVVCQEAVDIYRSIVKSSGTRSQIAVLAMSLSHLTCIAGDAKEYDLALQSGVESLNLYRGLLSDDAYFIQNFLITLQRTSLANCWSDNPQAVIQSARIISDYMDLETRYAQPDIPWCLVSAFRDRDFILGKHRLTQEALLNSEQLAQTVRSIPVDCVGAAVTLMDGLSIHAGNLSHAGRMDEALMTCEEGILQGRNYQTIPANQDLDLALADMLYQYSQCLRTVGRYTEAFAASEEMVAIHRRHSSGEDGICGLREHSLNLRKAKRYLEALEFSKEAVKRCRRLNSATTLADFLLPHTLESLSTCLAEIGDDDRALIAIEEAVTFYRKSKFNNHITNTWAYVEAFYAEALVNLACRSMMKEGWSVAEKALLEAKNIYQNRAMAAPGYCGDLAVTLDLTALFLHAVGRNDEGALVMQDLSKKQLHLETFSPEVAVLTQIALDDWRGYPSQLSLREKIQANKH